MLRALYVTLILFCASLANAQVPPHSEEAPEMIVYGDNRPEQIPEATEIEYRYDGREVPEADLKVPNTKEAILSLLREEIEKPKPSDHVVLSLAPQTTEELSEFSKLSLEEMKVFLRKKETFLRRFTAVLSYLKIKPSWINKAVAEVNEKFFRSSRLIANSNTTGLAVSGSVGLGLALPQKIVKKLKEKPIGRFIPESGGFYYQLGIGLGIVRTVDPMSKKKSFKVELFIDAEKLNKTVTGIIEATVAGTAGVVYEFREGDFNKQKMNVTYGGAAGLFKSGPNQFGWSGSLGVSAPPGIGAVLVYENQGTRYYFGRTILTLLFVDLPGKIYSEIAGLTRNLRARSCARVY